jgi:nucleoside 2-deoxyribosyltransferase
MIKPIDRAIAKNELERINSVLKEPHLLIGGLAVQQFYTARDSKDIDLVCSFQTARYILDALYPSRDWKVEDKQADEYRPSFQITHKVEDMGIIIFGPKISERAPYSYVDWDALKKGAHPFHMAKGQLQNILVPPVHSLAYTKFISFLGRQTSEEKIVADLKDFADLTNHDGFSVSQFYDLLRRTKSFDDLISNFRAKCANYQAVIETSCLHDVSRMFHLSHTTEQPVRQHSTGTVYIAAPHRNVAKNNVMKEALQQAGFDIRLPYDEVSKRRIAAGADRPDVIRSICIDAINASEYVVVDLDTYGLDTAWELGYAEGLGRRVIGYNQDVFLTTDARHINRREYRHNFMHGWERQTIYTDVRSVATTCKDKVVYVVGSFSNTQLETVGAGPLATSARTLILPKHYVDNQNQLPRDYPLAERTETNRLLEEADVVLVALPRYGMDSAWQIGYATAKAKQIIGLVLEDDGVELSRQSFWDHWMHAWKSKIRVTGLAELRTVLYGFTCEDGRSSGNP